MAWFTVAWGTCSETNRWLSGPSKTLGWAWAHGSITCGEGVSVERPSQNQLLMRRLALVEGGYRNRPKSVGLTNAGKQKSERIHSFSAETNRGDEFSFPYHSTAYS